MAVRRMLRTSPRKLDLVAGMIRGLPAGRAVVGARVLPQAHRARRSGRRSVGDRQRREQPQPRRRPALRGRGQRRQAAGDEAHARPRPRPRRPDREAVQPARASWCGEREGGGGLMGQKVNPIGLRLGINRTWDSRWFDDRQVRQAAAEDLKIRAFLRSAWRRPGSAASSSSGRRSGPGSRCTRRVRAW